MPEFLAETYAPRGAAPPCPGDLALAAQQASGGQAPTRSLGAVAVPEEETCFWLYQAPSAGAVRAAMTCAGLRPSQITPAICISAPRARPARAPAAGTTTPPHPRRTPPPAHRPARTGLRRARGRPDGPATRAFRGTARPS